MYKLIDSARTYSVKAAIDTVFNNAKIQDIIQLQGGSLSKTYKLIIENTAFIIRMMDLDESISNRQNQVYCLQVAAKIGIAPNCYYADADTGIIIMEYVEPQSTQITEHCLRDIAISLRTLHAYNQFPQPHQALFLYIDELIETLRVLPLSSLLIEYLHTSKKIMSILTPHLIMASLPQ